jgi:hypothetical protein
MEHKTANEPSVWINLLKGFVDVVLAPLAHDGHMVLTIDGVDGPRPIGVFCEIDCWWCDFKMATFVPISYTYVPTTPRSKSTATRRKPAPKQSSILDKLWRSKLSGAALSMAD